MLERVRTSGRTSTSKTVRIVRSNYEACLFIPDNCSDADAYFRLFDAAVFNPEGVSHGREGYFFVETSEYSGLEIIRTVGEALVELGLITEAEPDVFTAEERTKYFGNENFVTILFSNARCTADRIRKELGWVPKHTKDDFKEDIKGHVEVTVEKLKAQ